MDLTLRRFFSHKTVKIIVNVVSYILCMLHKLTL